MTKDAFISASAWLTSLSVDASSLSRSLTHFIELSGAEFIGMCIVALRIGTSLYRQVELIAKREWYEISSFAAQ